MFEEIKKQYSSFRLLIVLSIIAVSVYLFQIFWQIMINFSDIFIMLIIAWLLSFVLEPLVNIITKLTKLPKIVSAIVIYIFFAIFFGAMIFLFIPVVISQLQTLSKVIPNFLSSYPQVLNTWNNAATKSLDVLISIIPSLATIFINFILMLILSFYFVVDKERIQKEFYKLTPTKWHKTMNFIQEAIDTTFSTFFRIQVIFAIIAGLTTWLILTFFNIGFAASISLLAGVLTLIPVLGQFLGAFPPAFIVLVTHPESPAEALLIFTVLVLIQQVVFNVFGPKLMSNAFKLHPLAVFLSIIIGYKIAGALGAVLVVPVLGIAVIVLKKLGPQLLTSDTNS